MPTFIGQHPPRNAHLEHDEEWDCQCARCGSSMHYERCDQCGGEGLDGHDCGEDCCCCLDPEENVVCDICRGDGGWDVCCSGHEWCEANPMPGREDVKRGSVEWFIYKVRGVDRI